MTKEQWTIKSVLSWTQTYFSEKSVENPRLSAELLLADTLALRRIDLYIQYDRPLEQQELKSFKQKIFRRINHEPIAYITGSKAFWESSFDVCPHVLIPRPDTEILIETAIQFLQNQSTPIRVLELGVGSGAIIISLAQKFPDHLFFATDLSFQTLCVAKCNTRKILNSDTINFVISDWFSGISTNNPFQLIVSNPPYIDRQSLKKLQPDIINHEPHMALDGGDDGMAHIRTIIQNASTYLVPGGSLIMEMGFDQRVGVENLIISTGQYDQIQCVKDYSGHDRLMIMHRKKSE